MRCDIAVKSFTNIGGPLIFKLISLCTAPLKIFNSVALMRDPRLETLQHSREPQS
jgi:hypothetical protein